MIRRHPGVRLAAVACALVAAMSTADAPAAAVPLMRSHRLEAALSRYLAHRAGRVTVGVLDLTTGQRVLYRPRHPQLTASTVKVEILLALLARRHAPLGPHRAARARRMIEQSSNADAQVLWRSLGGAPALAAFGRRIGLRATRPGAGSGPGYRWGLTLTTPADQLRLLDLLAAPNRILRSRDRRYALRLLHSVEPGQRWGVTAGTSRDAAVAVKNGWLPLDARADRWQINSEGVVSAAHHHYLVAVMTAGDPTMSYGIATISAVSRLIWRLTSSRAALRTGPPQAPRAAGTAATLLRAAPVK